MKKYKKNKQIIGKTLGRNNEEQLNESIKTYQEKTELTKEQITTALDNIIQSAKLLTINTNQQIKYLLNDYEQKLNLATHIFIQKADEQTYNAKETGRNKLCVYKA